MHVQWSTASKKYILSVCVLSKENDLLFNCIYACRYVMGDPRFEKCLQKQLGLSFWEDHKDYIRTIGITCEGFGVDRENLGDALYSKTLAMHFILSCAG